MPDTRDTMVPIPIILGIKTKPGSDNEVVGVDYALPDPARPDLGDEEPQTTVEVEMEIKEDFKDEETSEVNGGPKQPLKDARGRLPKNIMKFRAPSLAEAEKLAPSLLVAAEMGSLRGDIRPGKDGAQQVKLKPAWESKSPESDNKSQPKVTTRPNKEKACKRDVFDVITRDIAARDEYKDTNCNKPKQDKIIQLFENKISDPVKILEGKTEQSLGDPHEIIQHSAQIRVNNSIWTLRNLSLPSIKIERLPQIARDAAESGLLRVLLVNETTTKSKATPALRRKLPQSFNESQPKVLVPKNPGFTKKQPVVNTVTLKKALIQKVSYPPVNVSSGVDNPKPVRAGTAASTSFIRSEPMKIKPFERHLFLDTASNEGGIPDYATKDITARGFNNNSRYNALKKEEIIQVIEKRIFEHDQILNGKTVKVVKLTDLVNNLESSDLALKKMSEKSGKVLDPVREVIVPHKLITLGRIVSSKKALHPAKLYVKRPGTLKHPKSSLDMLDVSATAKLPPAITIKSAAKDSSHDYFKQLSSFAEQKIQDYDNLMEKYSIAVRDKEDLCKRYNELFLTLSMTEKKLQEKIQECETVKSQTELLQARLNQIDASLGNLLTPNQIKMVLQETEEVPWSPEELMRAFTIQQLSKPCYHYFRQSLNYPLPSLSSIQKWSDMLENEKVQEMMKATLKELGMDDPKTSNDCYMGESHCSIAEASVAEESKGIDELEMGINEIIVQPEDVTFLPMELQDNPEEEHSTPFNHDDPLAKKVIVELVDCLKDLDEDQMQEKQMDMDQHGVTGNEGDQSSQGASESGELFEDLFQHATFDEQLNPEEVEQLLEMMDLVPFTSEFGPDATELDHILGDLFHEAPLN